MSDRTMMRLRHNFHVIADQLETEEQVDEMKNIINEEINHAVSRINNHLSLKQMVIDKLEHWQLPMEFELINSKIDSSNTIIIDYHFKLMQGMKLDEKMPFDFSIIKISDSILMITLSGEDKNSFVYYSSEEASFSKLLAIVSRGRWIGYFPDSMSNQQVALFIINVVEASLDITFVNDNSENKNENTRSYIQEHQ